VLPSLQLFTRPAVILGSTVVLVVVTVGGGHDASGSPPGRGDEKRVVAGALRRRRRAAGESLLRCRRPGGRGGGGGYADDYQGMVSQPRIISLTLPPSPQCRRVCVLPHVLTVRALLTHPHPVVTSLFCAQAVAREAVAASKGGAARGPPGLGPGDVDEVILASRAVDASLAAAAAAGGAQVCACLNVCGLMCVRVGGRAVGQPKRATPARLPAY
jgi:hypothetical protein